MNRFYPWGVYPESAGAPRPAGYYAYKQSQALGAEGYPFYSLIMAAMERADTFNLASLRQAFPDVYDELKERRDAPSGMLDGD